MDIAQILPSSLLSLPLELSGQGPTTLGQYQQSWVVLYFYPKDNTPGCTTEGIDFQRQYEQFQARGATIFGVSADSVAAHDRFRDKHGFRFPLISDHDKTLCQAFGVISQKSLFGRLVKGIERSTFLIAPGSQVVAAWRKVSVKGHVQEVLDTLIQQQTQAAQTS